ncbi:MAG: FAD binding domain-containing protein [Bacillota bacterium]
MRQLEFFQPENLDEAVNILSNKNENIKVLAGGTDLVIELRDDSLPKKINSILDISRIESLKKIKNENGEITIGALVTHEELLNNQFFSKELPFINEAASAVGSPQIRRRGTIGGNISNAAPCADSVPVLAALDAEVELISQSGMRKLSLAEFISGPYQTELKQDEIMTSVKFLKPESGIGTSFMKVGRRKALAISRMSVAVMIRKDKAGKVNEFYLSTGSVTPKPTRLPDAERVLLNQKPTDDLINETAEKVAQIMIATSGYRWSTEYKEPVIKTMVSRSIKQALEAIS